MGQLGLHRGLRTKGRSHTPRMSSHLEDVGRGQGARCSPAWSRKGGQLGAQRVWGPGVGEGFDRAAAKGVTFCFIHFFCLVVIDKDFVGKAVLWHFYLQTF